MTSKEQQPISQKAEALERFRNGGGYNQWTTLPTLRFDVLDINCDPEADLDERVLESLSTLDDRIEAFAQLADKNDGPVFVRACPLKPRPGVLESSRADGYDEISQTISRIARRMLSVDDFSDTPVYEDHPYVDPYGSIIVQRYIDATASAVAMIGQYIIMGPLNDGVTAGRDGTIVYLPHPKDEDFAEHVLKALDFDPDRIELEFVAERRSKLRSSGSVSSNHALVQLRGCDGPRPIATPPKGVTISGTFHGGSRIEVTHVHTVDGWDDDELARMEAALHAGLPEGSVVSHPTGSHLSHHAGQCSKYGVPYIAAPVSVGQRWTQAAPGWVVLDPDFSYEPQPYDAYDYVDSFVAGYQKGMTCFARQHGWLSNQFHQFVGGPIADPEQTAYLAGGFVAWLIRSTQAICLGEMRHHHVNKGYGPRIPIQAHALFPENMWTEYNISNRRGWYANMESHSFSVDANHAMFDLIDHAFGQKWNGGYGGAKYRKSGDNAHRLFKAMEALVKNPTPTKFSRACNWADKTEHNVHNNNFLFDKFILKSALDWGTNPEHVRMSPDSFFRVWYAADDLLTSEPRPMIDDENFLAVNDFFNHITEHDINKAGGVYKHPEFPTGMSKPHLPFHKDGGSTNTLACGHHTCTQPQCNPQLWEKKTTTTHKQVGGSLHMTWVGHEFTEYKSETTTTYTKKAKSASSTVGPISEMMNNATATVKKGSDTIEAFYSALSKGHDELAKFLKYVAYFPDQYHKVALKQAMSHSGMSAKQLKCLLKATSQLQQSTLQQLDVIWEGE